MMQTLALALRTRGSEGEPLPSAFKGLSTLRSLHRKSQVSLVAGAPGAGKSAYATHYVIKNNTVKALYLSPDSDRLTLGSRAVAEVVNAPLEIVEEALENEDEELYDILASATDHVWFNFVPRPSLRDITDEVEAYAYVMGEFPELIVLDNLKDVAGDGDNQERYHEVVDFMQELARYSGAHVMILHHVKGIYENGNIPIPFSGLLNNVGKTPRLVLTLHRKAQGVMGISVVKNSQGPADPAGEFGIDVGWLPERSWFSE